jgi:hypothetical protein
MRAPYSNGIFFQKIIKIIIKKRFLPGALAMLFAICTTTIKGFEEALGLFLKHLHHHHPLKSYSNQNFLGKKT